MRGRPESLCSYTNLSSLCRSQRTRIPPIDAEAWTPQQMRSIPTYISTSLSATFKNVSEVERWRGHQADSASGVASGECHVA